MEGKKTLIVPIPADKQAKRGWSVKLNGENVKDVTQLEIEHPNFGTLAYGLTTPGYDGWSFHEVGGGGAVIVPYVLLGKVLHIGVLEQNRHNQGGKVLNLPRGFVKPGENHFKAAARELKEETDYVGEVQLLDGAPMNPNSAFFETAQPGEGVRFYGLRVPSAHLGLTNGVWAFKPGALVAANADSKAQKTAEQILGARFIPWTEAVQLGDMFTVAGIARLVARIMT